MTIQGPTKKDSFALDVKELIALVLAVVPPNGTSAALEVAEVA